MIEGKNMVCVSTMFYPEKIKGERLSSNSFIFSERETGIEPATLSLGS